MSISSVSVNSMFAQMQQFKSGKTNLQKADLQKMQEQVGQTQTQGASPFDALLENFDKIDTNQDGISIDELKSFAKENGMPERAQKLPRPSGPPPSMMSELGPMAKEKPESVSKEDLLKLQSQLESQGTEVPSQLSQLIANFDSLDTNQDGKVSIEEAMATQKDASKNVKSSTENNTLDFLKLLEKYSNESSASSIPEKTKDDSKDMAIQFMRAMKQYGNFSSYSNRYGRVLCRW